MHQDRLSEKELLYTIALTLVKGIGPVTAKKLISHFETAENIFLNGRAVLVKSRLIQTELANELFSENTLNQAEQEIEFIGKHSITPLYFQSPQYPYRLSLCADSPVLLFTKGNANFNELRMLSIVGTRNATEYGRELTEKLIARLEGEPVVIVSGLAHGIDSYAHLNALKYKLPTIAVLGHGLQTIYPAINRKLAAQIVDCGALVTEFTSQVIADRENFPRRNRIIAGLSDAIIVVEANSKGGALITAEMALSYNRDVFAIPGKTSDTYSQGCNWLIKTNKAGLITSAEDLYWNMNWDMKSNAAKGKQSSLTLNENEEKIYKLLLQYGQCNIDFICNSTLMSLNTTAAVLLELEMNGVIKSLPGKMYRL